LKFRETNIEKRIFDEANDYVDTLTYLYSQAKVNKKFAISESDHATDERATKARELLVEALEQRLDHNLERIFRLLGLKYPPEDIENAYAGIKSNKPDVRINAVEFLDNLLEMNLKKVIIPIAETALVDAVIEDSAEALGLKIKSEFECLVTLLSSEDSRLQIHTLALIAQVQNDRFLPYITRLLNSPDEQVKEMAKFALRKMGIMN
jgi:AAA family ATP:ADP antiporter